MKKWQTLIDFNPFGEHDKREARHDEAGETIPLTPGEAMGGST